MTEMEDGSAYRITWTRDSKLVMFIEQTYNEERGTVDVSVKYPDGRSECLGSVEVR